MTTRDIARFYIAHVHRKVGFALVGCFGILALLWAHDHELLISAVCMSIAVTVSYLLGDSSE